MPFLPLDGSTGATVIDFQSVVLTLATRRLLDSSFHLAGIPGRITGGGGRREFRFQFSRGFSSSKWNFSKMGFLPIWSFPLGFSSIWNCFAQDPRRRLETSGFSYIRLCTNMKICNFACILIYSAQTNEFHLKRTKYRLG